MPKKTFAEARKMLDEWMEKTAELLNKTIECKKEDLEAKDPLS